MASPAIVVDSSNYGVILRNNSGTEEQRELAYVFLSSQVGTIKPDTTSLTAAFNDLICDKNTTIAFKALEYFLNILENEKVEAVQPIHSVQTELFFRIFDTLKKTHDTYLNTRALSICFHAKLPKKTYKRIYPIFKDLVSDIYSQPRELPFPEEIEVGLLGLTMDILQARIERFPDDGRVWCRILIPLLFNARLNIRNTTVKILKILNRFIPPNEVLADQWFRISLNNEFKENVFHSIDSADAGILDSWCFLVEFLGRELHNGSRIINSLLLMIEHAFKSPHVLVQQKALQSWLTMIDNFAMRDEIISCNKRVQLIISPLRIGNVHKQESLQDQLIITWWHVVISLQGHLSAYFITVVKPLLNHLFIRSENSPSKPLIHIRNPRIQGLCIDVLTQLLYATSNINLESYKLLLQQLDYSPFADPQIFQSNYKLIFKCVEETTKSMFAQNQSPVMLWHCLLDLMHREPGEGFPEKYYNKFFSILASTASQIQVDHIIQIISLTLSGPFKFTMKGLLHVYSFLNDSTDSPQCAISYYFHIICKDSAYDSRNIKSSLLIYSVLLDYILLVKNQPIALLKMIARNYYIQARNLCRALPDTTWTIWEELVDKFTTFLTRDKYKYCDQNIMVQVDVFCTVMLVPVVVVSSLGESEDDREVWKKFPVRVLEKWDQVYKMFMEVVEDANSACYEMCLRINEEMGESEKVIPASLSYFIHFTKTMSDHVDFEKLDLNLASSDGTFLLDPLLKLTNVLINSILKTHRPIVKLRRVIDHTFKAIQSLVSNVRGKAASNLVPQILDLFLIFLDQKLITDFGTVHIKDVEDLWCHFSFLLETRYADNISMTQLCPILVAAFNHSSSTVRSRTLTLWGLRFSDRVRECDIPSDLATYIKFLHNPEKKEKITVLASIIDVKTDNTVMKMDTVAVTKKRKNVASSSWKYESIDTEEDKFVLIVDTIPKKRVLTEHQKEVMNRRREDIPALHCDLTQDTQDSMMDTQDSTLLSSGAASQAGPTSESFTTDTGGATLQRFVTNNEVSTLQNSVEIIESSEILDTLENNSPSILGNSKSSLMKHMATALEGTSVPDTEPLPTKVGRPRKSAQSSSQVESISVRKSPRLKDGSGSDSDVSMRTRSKDSEKKDKSQGNAAKHKFKVKFYTRGKDDMDVGRNRVSRSKLRAYDSECTTQTKRVLLNSKEVNDGTVVSSIDCNILPKSSDLDQVEGVAEQRETLVDISPPIKVVSESQDVIPSSQENIQNSQETMMMRRSHTNAAKQKKCIPEIPPYRPTRKSSSKVSGLVGDGLNISKQNEVLRDMILLRSQEKPIDSGKEDSSTKHTLRNTNGASSTPKQSADLKEIESFQVPRKLSSEEKTPVEKASNSKRNGDLQEAILMQTSLKPTEAGKDVNGSKKNEAVQEIFRTLTNSNDTVSISKQNDYKPELPPIQVPRKLSSKDTETVEEASNQKQNDDSKEVLSNQGSMKPNDEVKEVNTPKKNNMFRIPRKLNDSVSTSKQNDDKPEIPVTRISRKSFSKEKRLEENTSNLKQNEDLAKVFPNQLSLNSIDSEKEAVAPNAIENFQQILSSQQTHKENGMSEISISKNNNRKNKEARPCMSPQRSDSPVEEASVSKLTKDADKISSHRQSRKSSSGSEEELNVSKVHKDRQEIPVIPLLQKLEESVPEASTSKNNEVLGPVHQLRKLMKDGAPMEQVMVKKTRSTMENMPRLLSPLLDAIMNNSSTYSLRRESKKTKHLLESEVFVPKKRGLSESVLSGNMSDESVGSSTNSKPGRPKKSVTAVPDVSNNVQGDSMEKSVNQYPQELSRVEKEMLAIHGANDNVSAQCDSETVCDEIITEEGGNDLPIETTMNKSGPPSIAKALQGNGLPCEASSTRSSSPMVEASMDFSSTYSLRRENKKTKRLLESEVFTVTSKKRSVENNHLSESESVKNSSDPTKKPLKRGRRKKSPAFSPDISTDALDNGDVSSNGNLDFSHVEKEMMKIHGDSDAKINVHNKPLNETTVDKPETVMSNVPKAVIPSVLDTVIPSIPEIVTHIVPETAPSGIPEIVLTPMEVIEPVTSELSSNYPVVARSIHKGTGRAARMLKLSLYRNRKGPWKELQRKIKDEKTVPQSSTSNCDSTDSMDISSSETESTSNFFRSPSILRLVRNNGNVEAVPSPSDKHVAFTSPLGMSVTYRAEDQPSVVAFAERVSTVDRADEDEPGPSSIFDEDSPSQFAEDNSSSFNRRNPIFPELVDFTDDVNVAIDKASLTALTAQSVVTMLRLKGVHTVGQLASMKESVILTLPLPEPKIKTIIYALMEYQQSLAGDPLASLETVVDNINPDFAQFPALQAKEVVSCFESANVLDVLLREVPKEALLRAVVTRCDGVDLTPEFILTMIKKIPMHLMISFLSMSDLLEMLEKKHSPELVAFKEKILNGVDVQGLTDMYFKALPNPTELLAMAEKCFKENGVTPLDIFNKFVSMETMLTAIQEKGDLKDAIKNILSHGDVVGRVKQMQPAERSQFFNELVDSQPVEFVDFCHSFMIKAIMTKKL